MTASNAPTAPFTPPIPAGSLGVSDAVAQAFRSASQAYQEEAAGIFRGGRIVAFSSPSAKLTMEQIAPAVAASADVARRGSITRFFTPPGSEIDYVLYATPVSSDLALIAFFTMDTPLGNARRSGQALVQAIVRAGAAAPRVAAPAGTGPTLPRDWVPERASAELERTLFPAQAAQAPPARPQPRPGTVALPKDWIPSAPADENRFPFLRPARPGTALAAAPIAEGAPDAHLGRRSACFASCWCLLPEYQLTGALIELRL
jgi:hypothetical protein